MVANNSPDFSLKPFPPGRFVETVCNNFKQNFLKFNTDFNFIQK